MASIRLAAAGTAANIPLPLQAAVPAAAKREELAQFDHEELLCPAAPFDYSILSARFGEVRMKCLESRIAGSSHGMAFQQDIVVTGIGVVSPIGIGKGPFWAALTEGRSGIRRLDLPTDPTRPPPIGGVVADFDPKQYVRPRKSLKVMSRDIQLAFAAADLACVEAGLRGRPVAPERLGVVFGASMIPCELDELVGTYRGCTVDGTFDFRRWGHAAMAELFPLWMLKYLPNMPACHVGIAQDARGPNNTVMLGDVSSLSALAEAARILERGQAEAIIAGGVGTRLHPALWVRSHVLGMSRPATRPARRRVLSTPSRRAGGRRRGRRPVSRNQAPRPNTRGVALAHLLGYAGAFEPCRNGQALSAAAIGRAIAAAFRDARMASADVGFVVAHGLSTIDNDRIEAQAIRDTLGDVPVTAPKSYFGYLAPARDRWRRL